MFHDIPRPILERMAYLETIDARDRQDGTPRARRMRQVTPETGRFIAIMAVAAPRGEMVEIGTSAGYSGLWLSLACRQRGDRLTTFDMDPYKVRLACETFRQAGVEDVVQVMEGDARQHLAEFAQLALCFMDAEKDLYAEVYELVVPRLVPGGLFLADNAISHQEELGSFIERALSDSRVDGLVVPIGKGVLLCRKL
ncbi:MAG: O-methyltransferase [Anaerolineales bacterium]